ncbi:MAG: SDR family NAD(P)-dependent oxidoreductase [Kofleriaceae bacterium]
MSDPGRPVVLVTGSTDGIGHATALALARAGARVVVHGRNRPRLEAAVAALTAAAPGAELDSISFDLGSLAAVRAAAGELARRYPRLDVLINNAGIFAQERVLTGDGFEASLAVNYVAPLVLTELLLPQLAGGTVINVSSIAHLRGQLDLGDLDLAQGFTGYGAYAQSKLAQVMHALSLAERHADGELRAFSLHPGVIETKLLREGFGPVRGGSVASGAATSVRLAAAVLAGRPGFTAPPDLAPLSLAETPSGSYLSDGRVAQPSALARDAALRTGLWATIAARTGLVGG